MANFIFNKTFNNIPIKLYHGTTANHYLNLKQGPLVNKGSKYKDFGQAFYLTSNFIQASKHAKNRSKPNPSKYKPIVFVYEITNLKRLKNDYWGYTFKHMNLHWATFIQKNRSRQKLYSHEYDYTYGGVADGKHILQMTDDVDNGLLKVNEYLKRIRKYPHYDQLAVHNQTIFTYGIIKLIKVVDAYDETKQFKHQRVR